MILVIDNYDSFTYNLVHYLGQCGQETIVKRNDDISPGPCTPNEAGISVELIQTTEVPLLGVCLGHQSIAVAFGGRVVKAPDIFHGKFSNIIHDNSKLYKHIDNPMKVVRYHSLIVEKESLPNSLEICSQVENDSNVILGLRHKEREIFGVQFHPD